jgi:N6-adenosine-specific RNA methylase IME4
MASMLDRELLRRLPSHLRIEIEENIQRKDFTESELGAIQRALIDELSKPEMKRQGARTDLTCTAQDRTSSTRRQNTTEKVAKLFGESERTVQRRLDVLSAAEAEPERFGKLVADMDRTGRVAGPYKRLKVARQAAAIHAEPPPLPGNGPYRVIVADPPWPYEKRDEDPSHRGVLPYLSMPIAQICALDVASIAHGDSVLWLWTTNAHMLEAYSVLDAWGFTRKTILTWGKDKMGLGDWLRGQTEHCLMAVRGKPVVQLTNQTTLLIAPVGEHSAKPREFYSMVEALCPASRYADVFSLTSTIKIGTVMATRRRGRPRHEGTPPEPPRCRDSRHRGRRAALPGHDRPVR